MLKWLKWFFQKNDTPSSISLEQSPSLLTEETRRHIRELTSEQLIEEALAAIEQTQQRLEAAFVAMRSALRLGELVEQSIVPTPKPESEVNYEWGEPVTPASDSASADAVTVALIVPESLCASVPDASITGDIRLTNIRKVSSLGRNEHWLADVVAPDDKDLDDILQAFFDAVHFEGEFPLTAWEAICAPTGARIGMDTSFAALPRGDKHTVLRLRQPV